MSINFVKKYWFTKNDFFKNGNFCEKNKKQKNKKPVFATGLPNSYIKIFLLFEQI